MTENCQLLNTSTSCRLSLAFSLFPFRLCACQKSLQVRKTPSDDRQVPHPTYPRKCYRKDGDDDGAKLSTSGSEFARCYSLGRRLRVMLVTDIAPQVCDMQRKLSQSQYSSFIFCCKIRLLLHFFALFTFLQIRPPIKPKT
jgi:hypothetical protein